jgi:predicted ATPase
MRKKLLNSLRLLNFKAFTDSSLKLKPLTLLSGLNSTGKSCVLQSILLLRQSFQQGLLGTGLALNGALVSIDTGQDALNEYAEQDFVGFEVTWEDETKAIWRFQYSSEADVLNLISLPVTESVMDKSIFTSNFCYLSSCVPKYKPNFDVLERIPEDGLLLIEHPEHLLNARSQTRLGEQIALCANRGVQIILETHSDQIFNGIRLAIREGKIKHEDVQFHYFQRLEKQGQFITEVISPNIDRNGRIDRWEDGFFDEWDKALEKLLVPVF